MVRAALGFARTARAASVTLAAALAAAIPLATPGPARADNAAAACEAILRRDATRYEGYDCLLRSARTSGAWEHVRAVIDRHAAAHPDEPDPLVARAFLSFERTEADAPARLRAAAAACARAGDRVNEAWVRRGLAAWSLRAGDITAARSELAAARALGAEVQDPRLAVALAATEAAAANTAAEYARALEQLDALPAEHVAGQPGWLRAQVATTRASALWGLGRIAEALEVQRERLELARAGSDHFEEAAALYSVIMLESRLRQQIAPDTVERAREGLALARRAGNRSAESAFLLALAQDPAADPGDRVSLLRSAVASIDPAIDLQGACFARRELSRALNATDPAAARALVDEAIALAAARGDLYGVARGHIRRATNVLYRSGTDLGERVREIADAMDAIERIRDLQPDGESQARVFGEWVYFYLRAIKNLLGATRGPREIDAAFRVSERLRARVLLGELDAAGATPFLATDAPRRAEHQTALQELTAARRALARAVPSEAAARRAEVEQLEQRAATLRGALLARPGSLAEVWGGAAVGVEDVRAGLAPDQALFSYVFPPREAAPDAPALLFVVTAAAGARVATLERSPRLDGAIALFESAVARRDGSEAEAARALHDALVAPGLVDLPQAVRRLVVVPDGPLHRLPLEVLGPGGGSLPLALRFEVSRAPSATLWLHWRRGAAELPPRVLALGDPHAGPSAGASVERDELGPLARAEREARVAGSIARGSTALTGAAAREGRFKRARLDDYSVLHIAAHAVIDERVPARSAVLLAAGDEDDGRLVPGEIARMPLAGQLVVLSACRTAEGAVLAGEGPMSLARAFLAAGAHVVVGSLWPLGDREAETMAARFYERLAEGATTVEALTTVRRERVAAGAPAADWSSLVVIGDADRRPLAGARPPVRTMRLAAGGVALVVALAALALLGWRRRFDRSTGTSDAPRV